MPKAWQGLASSGDGMRLLAFASNQTYPESNSGPCLYQSEDAGQSWRQVYCLGGWGSVAISADGRRLFATRSAGVFTSTDGSTWTRCGAVGDGFMESVAVSADGRHVLVASNAGVLLLSSDACSSWVSL